jgi:hypothetical protein
MTKTQNLSDKVFACLFLLTFAVLFLGLGAGAVVKVSGAPLSEVRQDVAALFETPALQLAQAR